MSKFKSQNIVNIIVIALQICILIGIIFLWNALSSSTAKDDGKETVSSSSEIRSDVADVERGDKSVAELNLEAIEAAKANIDAIHEAQASSTISASTKTTKKQLASVTAAENQTYTSKNRLFVTGDKGIYEIVLSKKGAVTKVIERMPKQKCAFGGIVEVSGHLYVNCNGNNTSYLYAAKTTASPTFKQIYKIPGSILANGLTADTSGRLYVASTFYGKIFRLTPSTTNKLSIAKNETWIRWAGLLTNGIKFANGSIYWTDGLIVKRASVKSDGGAGVPKILFGALAYFDDIAVDKDGILVADYIGASIRKYSLNGRSTGTVRASLSGPSSVMRARAPLPAGSLIVTERSGNRVSLITP